MRTSYDQYMSREDADDDFWANHKLSKKGDNSMMALTNSSDQPCYGGCTQAAFSGCSSLAEVSIPSSVTSISEVRHSSERDGTRPHAHTRTCICIATRGLACIHTSSHKRGTPRHMSLSCFLIFHVLSTGCTQKAFPESTVITRT